MLPGGYLDLPLHRQRTAHARIAHRLRAERSAHAALWLQADGRTPEEERKRVVASAGPEPTGVAGHAADGGSSAVPVASVPRRDRQFSERHRGDATGGGSCGQDKDDD